MCEVEEQKGGSDVGRQRSSCTLHEAPGLTSLRTPILLYLFNTFPILRALISVLCRVRRSTHHVVKPSPLAQHRLSRPAAVTMFCTLSLSVKALLVSVLLANLSQAQSPTIVYPTTAASTATPLPSAHGYTYIGCYNETTGIPGAGGARALSGGNSVRPLPCPFELPY